MTSLVASHMGYASLAVRVCLTVAILIGATACSGSTNDAGQRAAVGDRFAASALSVCAAAQKSKSEWSDFPASNFNPKQPSARQLPQVGAWLKSEVEPTFDAWLRDLAALGEPPHGQKTWMQVLTLVKKIDNLNKVQIRATTDGDTAAFAEATQALQDTQPLLERATSAAGVGKCADVHAG